MEGVGEMKSLLSRFRTVQSIYALDRKIPINTHSATLEQQRLQVGMHLDDLAFRFSARE